MRRRFGWFGLALPLFLIIAACASAPESATHGAASHPTVTRTPHATPVKLPGIWTAAYAPNAAEELRFAPSNPSLAYLCADNGPAAAPLSNTPQLYGSQGREWYQLPTPAMHPVPDPAQTAASCDIFIDAQNPKDIFFQQDEDDLQGAGRVIAQQLSRSRDGGATWSALATITNSAGFADIAVVGSRLIGRIYPVVLGGVPCTNEPTPRATSLIYASDDGGATWNPIGQSIEAAGYSVTGMATAGTTLFALTTQVPHTACQQQQGAMLWRSTDGGATWAATSLTEPNIQSVSFTPKADGSGYYGVAVAVSATGDQFELFSQDGGLSWALLPTLRLSASAGYVNAAVTPGGEVVAQEDGGAYLYICQGANSAAQWTPYARGSQDMSDNWRLQPTAQGARLWTLQYMFSPTPQSSSLTYLSVTP